MVQAVSEASNTLQDVEGLEIFLQAGELYFGSAPTVVSTMLHSRIAISFWHPGTRIGGLCHIIKILSPTSQKDMQYADFAINEYVNLANKYSTPVSEYEVRVFGGRVKDESDARKHEVALDSISALLKQVGFKICELDAFTTSSRKIKLDLASGKVIRSEIGNVDQQGRQVPKKREVADDFSMEIFLHPGDIYFGKAPTTISTLLGSCVAATLWHPTEKLGGMCHVVLPEAPDGICEMRYGDCAIGEFAKQAEKYQTRPNDYIVHIYGGSDMFPDMQKSSGMKIGDRNIEKVKQLLELFKFNVSEVDTGGTNSRKIRLDLSDGSVGLRKHGKPSEG